MAEITYTSPDIVAKAVSHMRPDQCAIFSDLDGTILKINPDRDKVRLDDQFRTHIRSFVSQGGLFAPVTGRDMGYVDQHIFPEKDLPISSGHGIFMREGFQAKVMLIVPPVDEDNLDALLSTMPLEEGMEIEKKTFARSIHYINSTDQAQAEHKAKLLADFVQSSYNSSRPVEEYLKIETGHKVFELGPAAANKGRAVEIFMGRPDFKGRFAMMFGDQPADASAMEVVNARGGLSVGVGPEAPDIAHFRVESPDHLCEVMRFIATPQPAPSPRNATSFRLA